MIKNLFILHSDQKHYFLNLPVFQLLFVIYMGIVAILLVNMLIAMMGNTYQKIAETRNEWQRQVTEDREVHRILLASLVYLQSIYCCFQSLGLHCIK